MLPWKHHIDLAASKAASSVGISYKLRPYLSQKTLIGLYYTFLYPYFTYCNEIWGNACKTYLSRLIMIQKRAIRLICYKGKYAPTNKIFKELTILNISSIYKFKVGQFMFKFHHQLVPSLFYDFFIFNRHVHEYGTRQQNMIHIPKIKSNISKRCISYSGCIIWNHIIKTMCNDCSTNVLKKVYRKSLLDLQ